MPNSDAFVLASQLRDSLESMSTQVGWTTPPQDQPSRERADLVYTIHPGARYLERESRPPWYTRILESWIAPIGTSFLWLALVSVSRMMPANDNQAEPDTDASSDVGSKTSAEAGVEADASQPEFASATPPDSSAREVLQELLREIEGRIDECGRVTLPMSGEVFRRWQAIYRDLRRKCVQRARDHDFDADAKERLCNALSELDWVIEEARLEVRQDRKERVRR
jgi:hypothetical protein